MESGLLNLSDPHAAPSDMAGSASGGGRGPRRISIWLKEHRGARTTGRCCIREARRVKGRGRSESRDATPNAQQCTPTARHVRPLLTAGDKRARPPPGRSKTRRDWLCRAARWIVGFPPRAEPHPGQTPSMSRLRGGSGPGSSATGSPWERAEHPARWVQAREVNGAARFPLLLLQKKRQLQYQGRQQGPVEAVRTSPRLPIRWPGGQISFCPGFPPSSA